MVFYHENENFRGVSVFDVNEQHSFTIIEEEGKYIKFVMNGEPDKDDIILLEVYHTDPVFKPLKTLGKMVFDHTFCQGLKSNRGDRRLPNILTFRATDTRASVIMLNYEKDKNLSGEVYLDLTNPGNNSLAHEVNFFLDKCKSIAIASQNTTGIVI